MEFLTSLVDPSILGVVFGLVSGLIWGAGDFNGGLASRRGNVFGVVIFAEFIGAVFLAVLALLFRETLPPTGDLLWGGVAGFSGGIGIAALYASLAVGQMGINAPIIAVLGGVIPVIVGIFIEGAPTSLKLIGFGVALIAVWLISRPAELEAGPPKGLGLAIIAGIGISGYFIAIDRVQGVAVFWPLVVARLSAIPFIAIMAMMRGESLKPGRPALKLASLAGTFDALGNVFFLFATQIGRMDQAVVLSSLYPVSTVLLARVLLKEKLTALQTTGIVLALVAIVIIAMPL